MRGGGGLGDADYHIHNECHCTNNTARGMYNVCRSLLVLEALPCVLYAGRHWCWKHYPVFWLPGGGGGVVRVTHGLTLAGDYLLPDWAHPATTGTVDTRGCRLHEHCVTACVVHLWVYLL